MSIRDVKDIRPVDPKVEAAFYAELGKHASGIASSKTKTAGKPAKDRDEPKDTWSEQEIQAQIAAVPQAVARLVEMEVTKRISDVLKGKKNTKSRENVANAIVHFLIICQEEIKQLMSFKSTAMFLASVARISCERDRTPCLITIPDSFDDLLVFEPTAMDISVWEPLENDLSSAGKVISKVLAGLDKPHLVQATEKWHELIQVCHDPHRSISISYMC